MGNLAINRSTKFVYQKTKFKGSWEEVRTFACGEPMPSLVIPAIVITNAISVETTEETAVEAGFENVVSLKKTIAKKLGKIKSLSIKSSAGKYIVKGRRCYRTIVYRRFIYEGVTGEVIKNKKEIGRMKVLKITGNDWGLVQIYDPRCLKCVKKGNKIPWSNFVISKNIRLDLAKEMRMELAIVKLLRKVEKLIAPANERIRIMKARKSSLMKIPKLEIQNRRIWKKLKNNRLTLQNLNYDLNDLYDKIKKLKNPNSKKHMELERRIQKLKKLILKKTSVENKLINQLTKIRTKLMDEKDKLKRLAEDFKRLKLKYKKY